MVFASLHPPPLPQVIHGAVTDNREQIVEASRNMGFLSGYESKVYTCLLRWGGGRKARQKSVRGRKRGVR